MQKLQLVVLGPGLSPNQLNHQNTDRLFLDEGGVVHAVTGTIVQVYKNWQYGQGIVHPSSRDHELELSSLDPQDELSATPKPARR